jgi:mono/diheme cytochrome c family protein
MNRQVGYIAYDYVILTGIALSCLVISKIPFSSSGEETNDGLTGAVNPSVTTNLSGKAYAGKSLFQSKCASCHSVFKNLTGPALAGLEQRGPWSDRKQLYKWIRNPEVFMKSNSYTSELRKQYGSVMTAFSTITDEEIDAIVAFISDNSSATISD